MKKLILAGSLIALSSIWVACDSKFVESSPDSVQLSGITLDERLTQKAEIDERINQIDQGVEKVKRIIDLFKKIQNTDQAQDVYTPIDFVLDVNAELKAKIPENRDGRLVRYSKIELPLTVLSEECRTLHTSLESSVIYEESDEESTTESTEKKAIGEKLTYSFRSCASEEKYLVAVEANWIGSNLEIKLNNENLETIFKDIVVNEVLKDSACRITQDSEKIIDTIHCSNIKVQLSNSEDAMVNDMIFNNSGEVRFEANADIFENARKKATSEITVLANGEVKFDLNKIEENASESQ